MWAFTASRFFFAQLGTLYRGDAGAHNEQHTVRHAAEDGSIGDDRDGGRVNDHIIEGVLQRLKDLLGRGGGQQLCGVRRDGADRQDRDAGNPSSG